MIKKIQIKNKLKKKNKKKFKRRFKNNFQNKTLILFNRIDIYIDNLAIKMIIQIYYNQILICLI